MCPDSLPKTEKKLKTIGSHTTLLKSHAALCNNRDITQGDPASIARLF